MKRRTVGLVVLMWITIGVVHALSRYADIVKYRLDVPFALSHVGYFILSYASWIAVTLVLLRIMRAPGFGFSYRRLAVLFVVGALLWLPLYFTFDYGVSTLVAGGGWSDWMAKLAATSGSVIFFYAVVYALTFALCAGVVLSAQAREAQQANLVLEQQKTQAALEIAGQQMQLMQSQLSPHFLFNCLSSISFLARRAERKTLVDAVARLGDLLRFTVENASRRRITIHEELAFVRDYVGLQELRFGGRFECAIEADPQAASAPCVPFSIQPLLENVFRHVVEQTPDTPDAPEQPPIRIRVAVAAHGPIVTARVCNSQPRQPDPRSRTTGTGIRNLETRLAHTYGTAVSLRRTVSASDYCVELNFPATMADDGA